MAMLKLLAPLLPRCPIGANSIPSILHRVSPYSVKLHRLMHPEHPVGWDRIWEGRRLGLAYVAPIAYIVSQGEAKPPPLPYSVSLHVPDEA
jgi:hypothetical protein